MSIGILFVAWPNNNFWPRTTSHLSEGLRHSKFFSLSNIEHLMHVFCACRWCVRSASVEQFCFFYMSYSIVHTWGSRERRAVTSTKLDSNRQLSELWLASSSSKTSKLAILFSMSALSSVQLFGTPIDTQKSIISIECTRVFADSSTVLSWPALVAREPKPHISVACAVFLKKWWSCFCL